MAGIPALVINILAVTVFFTNKATGVKPEERIIGGEIASPNEFPHQILVFQLTSRSKGEGNICGGSLISKEWVLTAAHCVTPKPGAEVEGLDAFTIIAGRYSGPTSGITDPDEQRMQVQKIFIHECYLGLPSDPLHHNDLALIKVSTPFTLNDKVKVIQLDEKGRATDGTETIAVGWGISNPMSNNAFPPALKKGTLFISDDKRCESIIPYISMESQICLNGTMNSVCNGDSGGPLLCNDGGVNYLCGVASIADIGCTLATSGFTRVFHFKDWIKEVMKSESNSNTDCVIPKVILTTPDTTTTTETYEVALGINDNSTTSRRGRACTWRKQHLYGLYIVTILVSFRFTY